MGVVKDAVYTVDIIIETDVGVPLITRKYPPYKGRKAIPGGKVDPEDYKLAGGDNERAFRIAAVREAKEEVVDGIIEIVRKIGVYDTPGRDPRGNYVSNAYVARIVAGSIRAASDAEGVELFTCMPAGMAFDHEKILRDSKVFERWDKKER